MRIPRIHVPGDYTPGQTLTLDDHQAHYLMRVLRLGEQHPIELFNGQGLQAQALLAPVSKKRAQVVIDACEAISIESPLKTTLVQAVSKGDRMDYSLQKAVELGVHAIVPVMTTHAMVRLNAQKAHKRQQQWQSIVVHACEQSGRTWVPPVAPIVSYDDWLAQTPTPLPGLVLNPTAETALSQLAQHWTPPPQGLTFIIGPEGGLSAEEIAQAKAKGLKDIRLGPRVLRTETAGVALLSAVQTLWGDQ